MNTTEITLDMYEIQIETHPNQTTTTDINGADVTFDINTYGSDLMVNASIGGDYLFSGIRLPINNPFYVPALLGYLYFTGSYDWTTLNITSFLYYLQEIKE